MGFDWDQFWIGHAPAVPLEMDGLLHVVQVT